VNMSIMRQIHWNQGAAAHGKESKECDCPFGNHGGLNPTLKRSNSERAGDKGQ
jgi:hypothetical protein